AFVDAPGGPLAGGAPASAPGLDTAHQGSLRVRAPSAPLSGADPAGHTPLPGAGLPRAAADGGGDVDERGPRAHRSRRRPALRALGDGGQRVPGPRRGLRQREDPPAHAPRGAGSVPGAPGLLVEPRTHEPRSGEPAAPPVAAAGSLRAPEAGPPQRPAARVRLDPLTGEAPRPADDPRGDRARDERRGDRRQEGAAHRRCRDRSGQGPGELPPRRGPRPQELRDLLPAGRVPAAVAVARAAGAPRGMLRAGAPDRRGGEPLHHGAEPGSTPLGAAHALVLLWG